MSVLIEEAAKKAAVAWVNDRLVWTAWLNGAFYVVGGPGEQLVPELSDDAPALVSLRGDHNGRIVTFPARVSTVDPGAEDWGVSVAQLATKRLNGPGTAEETLARWAEQNQVFRLEPTGDTAALPDGSLAAAPRPTPATRLPKRPFRLHRVRKRPN